jgi:hypothetical protein
MPAPQSLASRRCRGKRLLGFGKLGSELISRTLQIIPSQDRGFGISRIGEMWGSWIPARSCSTNAMRFAIGGVEGNDPIAQPRPLHRSPRTRNSPKRNRQPRAIPIGDSGELAGAAPLSRARKVCQRGQRETRALAKTATTRNNHGLPGVRVLAAGLSTRRTTCSKR